MTSNIQYNLTTNFPVAGQDNDTQIFRDNWDTIKTSLTAAATEITDLQEYTAKVNADNDFNNVTLLNPVLQRTVEKKIDLGSTTDAINFENGHYQILRAAGAITLIIQNFPSNENPLVTPYGVGRVTLELYGNGSDQVITFDAGGSGAVFKKLNWPNEGNTLTVNSSADPIIVEVWQHDSANIFLKFVGQFS